jgi:acetate kinase
MICGVTAPQQRYVLTMNMGSATLKSALYATGNHDSGNQETEVQPKLLLSITVNQTGSSTGRLKIAGPSGTSLLDSPVDGADSDAALTTMFSWLSDQKYLSHLAAAGHRLVHGGPRFKEPQLITEEVLSQLNRLVVLDPDHMPGAIRGIQFITRKIPDLPQVACFDTAFHSSLPNVARMYALPRRLYDQGIFRYGFHGLSYEFIMRELRALEGKLANGKVIIAHLGNGASIAAVKDGKSIDTSMGFTPLEGLVMGTRSGDVDPGALLYLLEQKKMSPQAADALLNKESGLLGVSGTSGDMRDLLGKAPTDKPAAEAVELFCYRAKKYIGAYAAALGGLDLLVFAGGIGEHAPEIRQRICNGLDFLGIRLDGSRNAVNAPLISHSESQVKVRVIKTDEDRMIMRHVVSTLGWSNGTEPASE